MIKVVTGKIRMSYVNLFNPRAMAKGEEAKYNLPGIACTIAMLMIAVGVRVFMSLYFASQNSVMKRPPFVWVNYTLI